MANVTNQRLDEYRCKFFKNVAAQNNTFCQSNIDFVCSCSSYSSNQNFPEPFFCTASSLFDRSTSFFAGKQKFSVNKLTGPMMCTPRSLSVFLSARACTTDRWQEMECVQKLYNAVYYHYDEK